MSRYRVELAAVVHVRYNIEVDARSQEQAENFAIQRAPEAATYWYQVDGVVAQTEVAEVKEVTNG